MARGFLNGESIVDIEAERDELLAQRTADHARIAQLVSEKLELERSLGEEKAKLITALTLACASLKELANGWQQRELGEPVRDTLLRAYALAPSIAEELRPDYITD